MKYSPDLLNGKPTVVMKLSFALTLVPPMLVQREPSPVELRQPRPAVPLFAHGHGVPLPSPKQ
jgi:hypothetical protein